ncbi:phage gp6-like head-tail connector protein [Enterococcus casseliflavus]|uniref:head-tail connector protein n=1 Tax=Enterococcus TaxID=1350 RepID=UPI001CBC986C|nr:MULTISPECIES: head-tail connector protein [Enterococcus]MBZ3642438.1 phage gp6-like head-tail connector protein [Enterococcus casseliflavus]MCD5185870.1 phage gp6-like head-tail connector protein [Enterococcus gallinarum]
MTIEELKNYLRIDTKSDDALLEMLKLSAESYVLGAVDAQERAKNDVRFKLAVALLVGSWYESRSNESASTSEIPFGVQSIITQLRGV